MRERFENIEAGDIVLVADEDSSKTIAYLVVDEGEFWTLIDLTSGTVEGYSRLKELLYDRLKDSVIDIVSRKIVANQINMQLGGRFKYPVAI